MQLRRIRAATVIVLLAAWLSAAFAGPDTWQGARLADFLRALADSGVRVIFSSDLVRETYRLPHEPDLSDPSAALAGALAPFGLTVTSGPGGALLVVRDDSPAPASVATPAPAEAPLPEIIVTSSLRRIENVHTDTHRYLDRELATRVPATAGEVVRTTSQLPGMAGGGISVRNHVRGGENNEVLFLLDGLRLYEPFHLKDFQSVATIISPALVAGIDVYAGAFPAHFGDRMSGVIELDIREPGARPETELALSVFNASALSLGTFGASEQGDWLASARRGNLDLVFDVVDPEAGTPRYNDVMLHAGWEFGPRAAVSANYLVSADKIRLGDPDRGETADARYRNQVFWLDWSADWNGALSSRTLLAHTTVANRRDGTVNLPGIVSGALDERDDFRILELKQDWTYGASGRWLFGLGFAARKVDGRFEFEASRDLEDPFDGLFPGTGTFDRAADLRTDGGQYAVYVEGRRRLGAALYVEAGLRWDQQDYTLARRDTQTSPRASLLYQAGERTEVRLGWGQYSQAQEVSELQVSDGVEDYFRAQRAEHVVLSLEHVFENGIELDLSVYRKSFRQLRPRFENAFNPLTILPEIQFDRVVIDARSGESRGAELLLTHESADRSLVWWLGYAWSAVEDEFAAGELKRSWDQPHTGKAGLSWRWRRWNFSATGRIHTGWPRTEFSARTVTDAGGEPELELAVTPLNARRYATFRTIDVRMSRDIDLRRGTLNLFLDVTNVADFANPCCLEYAVVAGPDGPALTARKAHWLPILPSLGAVWRF